MFDWFLSRPLKEAWFSALYFVHCSSTVLWITGDFRIVFFVDFLCSTSVLLLWPFRPSIPIWVTVWCKLLLFLINLNNPSTSVECVRFFEFVCPSRLKLRSQHPNMSLWSLRSLTGNQSSHITFSNTTMVHILCQTVLYNLLRMHLTIAERYSAKDVL